MRHAWKTIFRFASKLVWIAIVLIVAISLFNAVTERAIEINPISVPKSLADSGYTPEVAALRLGDALNAFAKGAKSKMHGEQVSLQRALPNINILTIGVPLDFVAGSIRSLLYRTGASSVPRRNISGELTVKEGRLWLRLRINDSDVYTSKGGVELDKPDSLFANASPDIFEKIQPYIFVVSVFNENPEQGFRLAQVYIAQLPKSDENVAWLYALEGLFYHMRKDYNKAADKQWAAINLAPWLPAPHVNLGFILSAQGKYDEAIAEYHKAINIDPTFAIAHNNLASILMDQKKDIIGAIKEYRKAIDADRKFARAHDGLGLALKQQQGDVDEAIAEHRAAIALDEKYAAPHNNLGVILQEQGRADEAIDEYRAAIALDEKYAAPHNRLGLILQEQGHVDEAVAEYRTAIVLNAKYVAPHINLGNILKQRGNVDEVIAEYRKAIALDSNNAIAHYDLGLALEEQGNRAEAIAQYRKALAIDPLYAWAQQSLARLSPNQ